MYPHWKKKRICLSLLVEQIYCKFRVLMLLLICRFVRILFKSESLLFCKGGVNLLQRESGVACSVLGFIRQRLLSRNDLMQQRKRVNLQEKLSIVIEPEQHSIRNLAVFKSKTTAFPPGGGYLTKCLCGEATVPKSKLYHFIYHFHEKGTPSYLYY